MPSLVEFDLLFLDKSWEWLNDPQIKGLTLTPDFTKQNQLSFYQGLSKTKDYWIKGITEDNVPIGAMGLKNINAFTGEYWGYIGEKQYWGKGIGEFMIQQAILRAKELMLLQIYLMVSEQNSRAKKLYSRMGFKLSVPGSVEKYYLKV